MSFTVRNQTLLTIEVPLHGEAQEGLLRIVQEAHDRAVTIENEREAKTGGRFPAQDHELHMAQTDIDLAVYNLHFQPDEALRPLMSALARIADVYHVLPGTQWFTGDRAQDPGNLDR